MSKSHLGPEDFEYLKRIVGETNAADFIRDATVAQDRKARRQKGYEDRLRGPFEIDELPEMGAPIRPAMEGQVFFPIHFREWVNAFDESTIIERAGEPVIACKIRGKLRWCNYPDTFTCLFR